MTFILNNSQTDIKACENWGKKTCPNAALTQKANIPANMDIEENLNFAL